MDYRAESTRADPGRRRMVALNEGYKNYVVRQLRQLSRVASLFCRNNVTLLTFLTC